MPAAVTDGEVDRWMSEAWPTRDTPLWSRQSRAYLQAERTARENQEARLAAEAARQAKAAASVVAPRPQQPANPQDEIKALKRRVKQLEELTAFEPGEQGKKGLIWDTLALAFEKNAKGINARLREIHERIDGVEKKLADACDAQVKFCGVYDYNVTYAPNSLVSRQGSLWCSLKETSEMPPSPDWRLAVKKSVEYRGRPDPGVSKP